MKRIVVVILMCIMIISLFACEKEGVTPSATCTQMPTETATVTPSADEKVFENQLVNDRHLFSQGYPEDWDYTQGEGGAELRSFFVGTSQGFLITKFISKTNTNLAYTVYAYYWDNNVGPSISYLMHDLMETGKFNDYFTEEQDLSRSDFAVTSSEYTKKTYISQVTWFEVEYDFTLDNEDWKGSYHVTAAPQAGCFFLVTCEAKATDWAATQATFNDMLADFRFGRAKR